MNTDQLREMIIAEIKEKKPDFESLQLAIPLLQRSLHRELADKEGGPGLDDLDDEPGIYGGGILRSPRIQRRNESMLDQAMPLLDRFLTIQERNLDRAQSKADLLERPNPPMDDGLPEDIAPPPTTISPEDRAFPERDPEGGEETQENTTIIFIINGEDVPIDVDASSSLRSARDKALVASHNTGRPHDEWEIRSEAGRVLCPDDPIDSMNFPRKVRLFLTLRVGAGGQRRTE